MGETEGAQEGKKVFHTFAEIITKRTHMGSAMISPFLSQRSG